MLCLDEPSPPRFCPIPKIIFDEIMKYLKIKDETPPGVVKIVCVVPGTRRAPNKACAAR